MSVELSPSQLSPSEQAGASQPQPLVEYLQQKWQQYNALDNLLSDDFTTTKQTAKQTDDTKGISYRQAILRISAYQQWLNEQSFNQPIGFYCDQSVEHLLMLIALMSTQLNFALLPADSLDKGSGQDNQGFGDKLTLSPEYHASLSHIEKVNHQVTDSNSKSDNSIKTLANKVYFRTSGSLGTPKVVVHSRDKLIKNSEDVLTRLPLNSQCRVLIPVPLYHMYGFGAALWPSLLVGANLHLSKNLNMLKFKAIEREFNPDVIYLTPPTVGALLLRPGKKCDYRFIVSAGDCFDVQQFERAEQKFNHIYNLYGSTELGVIAVGKMNIKKQQGEQKVNDTVSPLPNVTIDVDSQQLKVKHNYGFEGYLNHPTPAAYFETGDLVEMGDSGDQIRVIGRAKLSINREGRLIAFADLETRLKQHPDIEQAVIVKGPKDAKGHTLIAIVESKNEAKAETKVDQGEQIKRQLKPILPLFAMPSKVIIQSQLPRLGNGKLNRKQIAQDYEEIEL